MSAAAVRLAGSAAVACMRAATAEGGHGRRAGGLAKVRTAKYVRRHTAVLPEASASLRRETVRLLHTSTINRCDLPVPRASRATALPACLTRRGLLLQRGHRRALFASFPLHATASGRVQLSSAASSLQPDRQTQYSATARSLLLLPRCC